MHCLAFVARYLDVFTNAGLDSDGYLTYSKIYILIGAISTVLALIQAHGPFSNHESRSILSQVLGTSFVCLLLGFSFNYNPLLIHMDSMNFTVQFSFIEAAWAFSVYLAAVADVPQLTEYDRMEKKDGLLTAYLVLCFAFRALHLPHWVLRCVLISAKFSSVLSDMAQLTSYHIDRFLDEGRVDPISIVGGLVQTSIYIVYGFFIVLHHSRRQVIALDTENAAASQNDNASCVFCSV